MTLCGSVAIFGGLWYAMAKRGALAMDDLLNGCEADPVIDGYAPHRFSGFMPGENDRNLLNADLCVPVGIPSYAVPAPAPPCHLVIGIIFAVPVRRCAEVDACRVIARMQDGRPRGLASRGAIPTRPYERRRPFPLRPIPP